MARHPDLTMAELARIAGVSVSTVSRALAGSKLIAQTTRDEIAALAREHGFEPNLVARNLRTRRTGTIAVVLPLGHQADQHLTDPFFMTMIGTLADELTERGYDMLLRRVVPADDRWLSSLLSARRADGVIILGQSDQHAVLNSVAETYPNMVVWGAHLADSRYLTIGSDNRLGGRLAARYLLGQGRRSLLMLGHPEVPEFLQREQGFREECAAEPGVSVESVSVDLVPAKLTEQLPALLADATNIDGIFAASDVIAMAAIAALQNAGRQVPTAVSVIGYDRVPLTTYGMTLPATIDQKLAEGASLLVNTLLDQLANRPASSRVIKPEIFESLDGMQSSGAAVP